MTMKFRTVKTSLLALLNASEAGRYQTVGFQRQQKGADEVKGNNRLVQLYYSRGSFPKSSSSLSGPFKHTATYQVDLTCSEAATVDLATLNNPASSPAQITAALAAKAEAAKLADDSLDELFDIVYQIIMDARQRDLDLGIGGASDIYISDFQKDEPDAQGRLVTITGAFIIGVVMEEIVSGETSTTQDQLISGGTVQTVDIETESETDETSETKITTEG